MYTCVCACSACVYYKFPLRPSSAFVQIWLCVACVRSRLKTRFLFVYARNIFGSRVLCAICWRDDGCGEVSKCACVDVHRAKRPHNTQCNYSGCRATHILEAGWLTVMQRAAAVSTTHLFGAGTTKKRRIRSPQLPYGRNPGQTWQRMQRTLDQTHTYANAVAHLRRTNASRYKAATARRR